MVSAVAAGRPSGDVDGGSGVVATEGEGVGDTEARGTSQSSRGGKEGDSGCGRNRGTSEGEVEGEGEVVCGSVDRDGVVVVSDSVGTRANGGGGGSSCGVVAEGDNETASVAGGAASPPATAPAVPILDLTGPVRAVVAVRFLHRRLLQALPDLLPPGAAVLACI